MSRIGASSLTGEPPGRLDMQKLRIQRSSVSPSRLNMQKLRIQRPSGPPSGWI